MLISGNSICRPIQIIRVLLYMVCVTFAQPDEIDLSTQQHILAGQQAIKEKNWDMASFSFMMAYEKGMSEDSLKYFLAEVALNQGDLEEALALIMYNQNSPDSILANLSEIQMATLQAILDADTIPSPPNPTSIFKPYSIYASLNSASRYSNYVNINPQAKMFITDKPNQTTTKQDGFTNSITLTGMSSWNFDWLDLTLGINSAIKKSYYNTNSVGVIEPFLSLSDLIEGLDIEYQLTYEKEREFEPDPLFHSLQTDYSKTFTNYTFGATLNYNFDRNSYYPYNDYNGEIYLSHLKNNTLISGRLRGGVHYSSPSYSSTFYRVWYVDNVEEPKPIHYTDSTFTDSIFLPNPFQRLTTYQQYEGFTNTIYNNNYYLFQGGLEMKNKFLDKISVSSSITFYILPYLKRNYWIGYPQLDKTEEDLLDTTIILVVKNKQDGRYYNLLSNEANATEKFSATPKDRYVHRLDNILKLGFDASYDFKKWGSILFFSSVTRYWTNIKDMPTIYRIPKWRYMLYLGYSIPLYERYL